MWLEIYISIYLFIHSFFYLIGKGGYVFGSVGLSVCEYYYSKYYEQIVMKLYGGV